MFQPESSIVGAQPRPKALLAGRVFGLELHQKELHLKPASLGEVPERTQLGDRFCRDTGFFEDFARGCPGGRFAFFNVALGQHPLAGLPSRRDEQELQASRVPANDDPARVRGPFDRLRAGAHSV